MKPQDLIAKKRDGETVSREEIQNFVDAVVRKEWTDYQISAFLMACFIRGLNDEEQTHLTRAMLDSGKKLEFSEIEKPIVDKHSTGGVGDKTSLIIAPLAAACGLAVPMISGRGLGHTGGTLDKLESIKGYNVNLSIQRFRSYIKKCGFAMMGQTAEIAPADKKIYALRDATATVNSIPLIVASIMSKKLAAGIDALVLDVKTGSGAFMVEYQDSVKLAKALVKTGNSCGVKTEAVISDMSQPLGRFSGNALEVYECVKILRNETDELMQPTLLLSKKLTARMLILGGIVSNEKEAEAKIKDALESGKAFELFRKNIIMQNGNAEICDKPEKLINKNLLKIEVKARKTGFVSEIDTHCIGDAIIDLGGGRCRAEDKIDHAVGIESLKTIGDSIAKNETLAILYCRKNKDFKNIADKVCEAHTISQNETNKIKLIKKIIS